MNCSKIECEELGSSCRSLREELIYKRKQIQNLISKDSGHVDLRLSITKLDTKFSSKMTIDSPEFGNKG